MTYVNVATDTTRSAINASSKLVLLMMGLLDPPPAVPTGRIGVKGRDRPLPLVAARCRQSIQSGVYEPRPKGGGGCSGFSRRLLSKRSRNSELVGGNWLCGCRGRIGRELEAQCQNHGSPSRVLFANSVKTRFIAVLSGQVDPLSSSRNSGRDRPGRNYLAPSICWTSKATKA